PNSHTPPDNSRYHFRNGQVRPISGLTLQRLAPMLISLSGKYSPVGATTNRLAPNAGPGVRRTNSRGERAGLPSNPNVKRNLRSPNPVRVTLRVTSPTSPFTCASTYGRASARLALRPNRPNVCPYAATTESIVPDTFCTGSAGSTETPPLDSPTPNT